MIKTYTKYQNIVLWDLIDWKTLCPNLKLHIYMIDMSYHKKLILKIKCYIIWPIDLYI